jgi:hypothetical protein
MRQYPAATPPPPAIDQTVRSTEAALNEELVEIERRRVTGQPVAALADEGFPARAARLQLSALCLSGGGIRSAAFSLGVMQGLAKAGLLIEFDYLSTVSGGGFAGGWLQMLLRQPGADAAAVQAQVRDGVAPAVDQLRAAAQYLTPQVGAFSADGWGAVALYLRNLLINWMVFTPLFLLLALLPIFGWTLMRAFVTDLPTIGVLLLIATLALAYAVWQGAVLMPSHWSRPAPAGPTFAPPGLVRRAWMPVLVWAGLAPFAVACAMAAIRGADGTFSRPWMDVGEWALPVIYAAALCVGYAMGWISGIGGDARARALYRRNALRWIAATACAALLLWLGLHVIRPGAWLYMCVHAAMSDPCGTPRIGAAALLAAVLPLALIGTHVLQTTFYVAFRKDGVQADLDREWLARLSGLLLRAGMLWTIFAACCLVLPQVLPLLGAANVWLGGQLAALTSGTTALGALTAWLGRKLDSRIEAVAGTSSRWVMVTLNALSLLYGLGLLVVSGSVLLIGLGAIEGVVFPRLQGWTLPDWAAAGLQPGALAQEWLMQLILGGALGGLVLAFGKVNVNRFSMHAAYRNRLVRAFLGAARAGRAPDGFTGFDPNDNPRLKAFAGDTVRHRLFPVINMTLNVSGDATAAWSERKAESFTATPLVCGSGALDRRDRIARGAFVRTADYAGMDNGADAANDGEGVTIGTVLTISGAAASPNWGYHSSPATAFLMTLFNVRLGAWLPNPAVATPAERRLAKPRNSVTALISELIGSTTDTRQSAYLSDGGHFENLGIYEMLRRRCRWIVVVDAGQDGNCAFFDLGNAIRKAAIDLDVRVTMQPMRILARQALDKGGADVKAPLGFAVGQIAYPAIPGPGGAGAAIGSLLYVKPSFLDKIPADVRAYGRTDPEFPHDSTLHQWFTESQFESYRALGAWQMGQIAAAVPVRMTIGLEDLFIAAAQLAAPAPAAA